MRVTQRGARGGLVDGGEQLDVEVVRAEKRCAMRHDEARVRGLARGGRRSEWKHDVRVVRRTIVASVARGGDGA